MVLFETTKTMLFNQSYSNSSESFNFYHFICSGFNKQNRKCPKRSIYARNEQNRIMSNKSDFSTHTIDYIDMLLLIAHFFDLLSSAIPTADKQPKKTLQLKKRSICKYTKRQVNKKQNAEHTHAA